MASTNTPPDRFPAVPGPLTGQYLWLMNRSSKSPKAATYTPIDRFPVLPDPPIGPIYDDFKAPGRSHLHLDDSHYAPQTQTLDFGRLETRFLSIKALRTFRSNVSCELHVESLFDCSEYTALSYCWGDHVTTRMIILDGCPTPVTQNLEMAPDVLVARGVKTLWVDALCIDQKNDYEKIYQLRQMGTIYSKATKVVAWLGPAADDSDNAMQALSDLSNSCEGADVDQHSPVIMRLLRRPYWERVWIIQELVKASSVEIWCGSKMLPWEVFIRGFRRWRLEGDRFPTYVDHPILTLEYFCDAERQIRKGTSRMLLSTAMVRTLHTKATVERDRIYALLGIVRDDRETVPTPNYVQSDAQVFESVIRHMIVEQSQLDLMFLARYQEENGGSAPSWLPVWTNKMPLQASPWLLKCFELLQWQGLHDVRCHVNVLEVNAQVLGYLVGHTTAATYDANLDFMDHFLQFGQQLHMWRGSPKGLDVDDNFDNDLSGRVYHFHRLHTLARSWHLPTDEFRLRCPKLRQWYEANADQPFDNKDTLRSWVEAGAQIPSHYRATWSENLDLLRLTKDYHRPLWPWLAHLEASASTMLRHGVRLHLLGFQGSDRFVCVPKNARTADVVAHVDNCSLPVVLRPLGEDRYSVVGEVADDSRWQAAPAEISNASGPRLWFQPNDVAWRTLRLV